jgi:ribonuclease HII
MVTVAYWAKDEGVLRRSGARDSKTLTPASRERLARSLVETGAYCVLVVPAGSIDNARVEMTMNDLEVLCFSTVGASILLGRPIYAKGMPDGTTISVEGGCPDDRVVKVDAADVLEERFGAEVRSGILRLIGGGELTLISKHKADRDHPSVGAASIIAKVERDRQVRSISEMLGIDIGSGYPSDPVTVRFLEGWVRRTGSLPPQCRHSWETARKLVQRSGQTTFEKY